MSGMQAERFDDVLTCETELPFVWHPLESEPTPSERRRHNLSNLHVMDAVAVLEDHVIESREEDGPVAQDVMRLDAKLNLLLELVARLISADCDTPPATALRFNSQGLEWEPAAEGPPLRQLGYAIVHLRVCPAMPLYLMARVEQAEPAGSTRTRVLFEGVSGAVREALQKLVFRQHRRTIAGGRHPHVQ